MISKKTCLVLGAGASRPYMLPTSRDLRHIILGSRWGKAAFERLGFNPALTAVERYDAALLQAGFSGKIIVFANALTAEDRQRYADLRVDRVIDKPGKSGELVGAISELRANLA